MAAVEKVDRERRHRDDFSLKFAERALKSNQIRGVGENSEIRVATKLRRAVKHARLSTHQQRLHLVRSDRRKDSAYRVRDQASLK